jgi:hypothetical protein
MFKSRSYIERDYGFHINCGDRKTQRVRGSAGQGRFPLPNDTSTTMAD